MTDQAAQPNSSDEWDAEPDCPTCRSGRSARRQVSPAGGAGGTGGVGRPLPTPRPEMVARAAADLVAVDRRSRQGRRKALAEYRRLREASARLRGRDRRDYLIALHERFRQLMIGGGA